MSDRRYTYQMCECGNPDCVGCEPDTCKHGITCDCCEQCEREYFQTVIHPLEQRETDEIDNPYNPYSEQNRELWDEPTEHSQ